MLRARTSLLCVIAALVATALLPAFARAALPASIRMVGGSCDKPLQLDLDAAQSRQGQAIHAYDDHWMTLTAAPAPGPSGGPPQWTISWQLGPGLALCPGGRTRLGLGIEGWKTIEQPSGSRSGAVPAGQPVQGKLRARFAQAIAVRGGLSGARLKALVVGWTKRSCALKGTNRVAAGLLADLAGRAGAAGCRPPRKLHVTPLQLLKHLTAYLNASRPSDGPSLGPEYYRVLAQLTTFSDPSS